MARTPLLLMMVLSLLMISLAGCSAGQTADGRPSLDTAKPHLDIRIDTEALSYLAMEPVRFDARVSGGDGDYSYIWDFNAADGYDADGFESVARYIYPEPGQYTVSLHVADSSGASGEATAKIHVKTRGYVTQKPVETNNLLSSPDRPYVIDGYDITNPDGNGITLRNCENIIIRNCYIHDCTADNGKDSRAICAEGCHSLTIQNVYVKNSKRGILVEGNPDRLSSDIMVECNVVVGSEREDGVSFRNVERAQVRGNILYDNGKIWEDRISGISLNGTFHHISVHHNLVVNSNSDGIESMGYEKQDIATNVQVYANVLRNNGEQGVWLFHAKNSRVHHNYIEGSHNNGVFLEGWVSGACVDHNVIIRCGGTPGMKHHGGGAVGIQYSCDNVIQHNILADSTCGDVAIGYPEASGDWMEGMDSRFRETAGNIVDSNVMCSSECNINVADSVSSTFITNNIVWQRGRGRYYHGCSPDKSNIKAEPLFRAPERGDFALLSDSPGYGTVIK